MRSFLFCTYRMTIYSYEIAAQARNDTGIRLQRLYAPRNDTFIFKTAD